jgi:hypothetical protein
MTQPSGRVLGSPSRYRTYLRSSPIICAIDAFSFILRLIISPSLFHVPFSEAIAETIRQRYDDIEDDSEGLQSLEKMTVLRWVFFVLGTLGPAIKMAAMQGIPWTKAWGMMYLASFLVFEGMALMAKRSADVLPGNNIPLLTSGLNARSMRLLKAIEVFAFMCAIFAHAGLLMYAVLSFFLSIFPSYSLLLDPKFGIDSVTGLAALPFSGPVPVILFLSLLPSTIAMVVALKIPPPQSIGLFYAGYGALWIVYMGGSVVLPNVLRTTWNVSDDLFFTDLWRLSFFFTLPFILHFLVTEFLCPRYPMLAQRLLIPDGQGAWTLTFFITNLAVCILWYAFRYNQESTVNPGWTGIFG